MLRPGPTSILEGSQPSPLDLQSHEFPGPRSQEFSLSLQRTTWAGLVQAYTQVGLQYTTRASRPF